MNGNEWPYNLWEDIWSAFPFSAGPRDSEESDEKDFVLYWPNLDNVISAALDERHQKVLHMRYESGMTYKEIGAEMGVGAERIRQMIYHAHRKLREPRYFHQINAIPETEATRLHVTIKAMTSQQEELQAQIVSLLKELDIRKNEKRNELPPDSPVRVLGLTPRSYNRLIANSIETVGDLVSCKESTLMHFRGMGKTCVEDIKAALAKYDYELAPEE